MFLSEPSVSALWNLLTGYQTGISAAGGSIDPAQRLPDDFHDWVAYRLHFKESTSGWRNMILKVAGAEAKALSLFFELYDEHTARKAHVFAKLLNIDKTYRVGSDGNERVERYPKSLSFVTYTDDPGFFVYSDEPGVPWDDGFYPLLDWFETFHGLERRQLTVIDPVTFSRLDRDSR